ncbi:MAG TPA: hypothetical protein VGG44_00410, partial [Tepidisphaeraceae bacterium]
THMQITVRFLHLMDRKVADAELNELPSLQIGDRTFQSWQEAEEREINLGECRIGDLSSYRLPFQYSDCNTTEAIQDDAGNIAGMFIRHQQSIQGSIEVSTAKLTEGLYKLTIRILNESDLPPNSTRDQALMRSLVSTHTILGVDNGEFVSMTDPPADLKCDSAECRNIGAWPVLVGIEPQRDTILSSPIILYDYPQLAPESPGDLFDSTEIDEILTLRILTLTDDEKRAAAGVDGRVRDLLARTESLARDQLMNLHGTIRGLRPVPQEQNHG